MKDALHACKYPELAVDVFRRMISDGMNYIYENDLEISPTLKWDILTIMMTHPNCTSEWKSFILDKSDQK